jgi:hypothetical protein
MYDDRFVFRSGTVYYLPHHTVDWPHNALRWLDVEICMADAESTAYTHVDVMRVINQGHRQGFVDLLHFKVIDCALVYPAPFMQRYRYLVAMFPWQSFSNYSLVYRFRPHGSWAEIFPHMLELCRQNGYEGVVFQGKGMFRNTGKRDVACSFKLKVA